MIKADDYIEPKTLGDAYYSGHLAAIRRKLKTADLDDVIAIMGQAMDHHRPATIDACEKELASRKTFCGPTREPELS